MLATSIEVYNVSVNQILVKDYVHHEIVSPEGKIVTDKSELRDPRNQKKVIGTGAAEAARQLAPILEMNPAVLGGKWWEAEASSTLLRMLAPRNGGRFEN